MKNTFEIASGTIIGRDHRIAGKNNQDAFFSISKENCLVAVVCDGCGSSPMSEVGAKIGARIIATEIIRSLSGLSEHCQPIRKDDWEFILACVYNKPLLGQIENLALGMADCQADQESELVRVILDYFLFTAVGIVITPKSTIIFSAGDGIFGINFQTGGVLKTLGPFPGNAPPYPAYGLIESAVNIDPKILGLKLQAVDLSRDVESLIIGTDGALDLAAAAEKNIPGRDEVVGPLSQFWENDLYFKNPDALRRRLSVINSDVTKPNWEEKHIQRSNGLLRDDTTLVVIRRKKQ
jgi:hypothetical protein